MNTVEIMTIAVELLAQREFNEKYPSYCYPSAQEQLMQSQLDRLYAASGSVSFERGCKVAIRSYFRLADEHLVNDIYGREFASLQAQTVQYA